MGDVLAFKRPKNKKSKHKNGHTLCKNGFHKWEIHKEKQFDVKQGKLVTLFRCVRCGKTKTELK